MIQAIQGDCNKRYDVEFHGCFVFSVYSGRGPRVPIPLSRLELLPGVVVAATHHVCMGGSEPVCDSHVKTNLTQDVVAKS